MSALNAIMLTSYSRLGGCSCKLGANDLAELCDLSEVQAARLPDHLPDDAAIIPLGDGRALVTSVDFQTPIVDDPHLAGEIAAKNALSDIFACGAQPAYADVVLVVPFGGRAVEIGQALMRGVADACRSSGCKIVGGHTIHGETPIVGLAVYGIQDLGNVKRKSSAQPGDVLLITKPIGTGIAIAARQQGILSDADLAAAISVLCKANDVGARLGMLPSVSAMTDITGFGLLGHLCEIAEASRVSVHVYSHDIPVLPGILRAAQEGIIPDLSDNNLRSFQSQVAFHHSVAEHRKLVLFDPQTNGGLLVAVTPDAVGKIQSLLDDEGISAQIIGKVVTRDKDEPLVRVLD